MIRAESQPLPVTMPHPLSLRAAEVVRYVRAAQAADRATQAALAGAEATAAAQLRTRQRGLDAAVARQVNLAAHRLGRHRAESLTTLNAIFKLGHAPTVALDGRYRGELNSSTLWGPFDSFARWLTGLWLPWKGKRFFAATQSGDNVFSAESRYVGRLFWPTFGNYYDYRPGLVTAFPFATRVGPGLNDPEVTTLKLDYDQPANPRLIIRAVLDEVVQITSGYCLGKVYLRVGKTYLLAGFFALRNDL